MTEEKEVEKASPSEVSTTDSAPAVKTGVKSGPDVIIEG